VYTGPSAERRQEKGLRIFAGTVGFALNFFCRARATLGRAPVKFTTDDVRITGMEEVIAPKALITQLPISSAASRLVFDARKAAADIIHGRNDRLIVIVGPCSIHDPDAAREYASRLKPLADRLSGALQIIMRVYFEKPRTIVGWKGLIDDPDLNDSYDVNRGLKLARQLLLDIAETGLPAGTEYLDPITPQYLSDLISWGAIGARTTESQVHRELASALSCPVGFKNSTDGAIQVAVDAVNSAGHPHSFLSVTKDGHSAIFSTAGNSDCHVILRGGGGKPNFDAAHVAATTAKLQNAGLKRGVMVDFSHANSQKDPERQHLVCEDVCHQLRQGSQEVCGVMIESHLVAGRQDAKPGQPLTYGQSITDACIGWDGTETMLQQLADAVEARRAASSAA